MFTFTLITIIISVIALLTGLADIAKLFAFNIYGISNYAFILFKDIPTIALKTLTIRFVIIFTVNVDRSTFI